MNYYLRCLKKLPHGGVANIDIPNLFLHHFTFDPLPFFTNEPESIPYFMKNLVDIACDLYGQCEVDFEELLQYCFQAKNWYIGFRLLHPKPEYEKSNSQIPLIWTVIENNLNFLDYFTIEERLAIYAFICILVQERVTKISDVADIKDHEVLDKPCNRYGLTLINDAEFFRQGFRIGDKYYLYNIFMDTSIGSPADSIPYPIRIIQDIKGGIDLYMRCDENLAVPFSRRICTATVDAQKYRGITVDFANIDSIVFQKEVIVHIHPDTMNKILLIIKPGNEIDGQKFFHIEIEELWCPDLINDEIVATNYIHAKYYPEKKNFNHVDFSVNQYSAEVFKAKYNEAVNETGIPIDKYADIHYKIWCIEGEDINVSIWSYLVCATLDEPFREIFLETFIQ